MAANKFSLKDFLNEQSLSAPEAEAGTGFTIKNIPIEEIESSSTNIYGVRDIDELAASIEEMGLLHNLVVREKNADGKYELISGERRFLACQLLYDNGNLTYATIPCKIEKHENDLQDELKLLYANATSRVLTDYEKTVQAACIKKVLQKMRAEGYKFQGRMREAVADILKISTSQMQIMESIENHLIPELKKEFETGAIGITAAYEYSKLRRDEQYAVLDRYKTTGSFDKPKKPDRDAVKTQLTDETQNENLRASDIPNAPEKYIANEKFDAPHSPVVHDDAAANSKSHPSPPDAPEGRRTLQNDEGNNRKNIGVTLYNMDGTKKEFYGNLGLIAAVDTHGDKFDGAFTAGKNVTALDYAALAKVVVEECLERIGGDALCVDVLYENIMKFFGKN